jgi:hypothetical protein
MVALPAHCLPLGCFVALTIFSVAAPLAHLVARRRWRRQLDPEKGIATLSAKQLRIAPRQDGDGAPSPRMLSDRRGGHDPPSRPPMERFGYYG